MHLPSNVQEIANQLPQNVNNTSVFSVKFLHTAYTTEDYKYQVSGFKLKNALIWLKTFNKLCNEIKIIENFKETVYGIYRYIEGTETVCHDELLKSLEFSTLTPLDCNIPNVSIKKYMSNGVIEVPSIKENPVNVYETDQGEEKAFPWLFPTGMFGFSHEREQKLSLSMYLKKRLYNYRGHFRKNVTYLLHSAVAVDLSHLKSEIQINMRIRKKCQNSHSWGY